VLIVS